MTMIKLDHCVVMVNKYYLFYSESLKVLLGLNWKLCSIILVKINK